MPRRTQAWLERGRFALALGGKCLTAKGNLFGSKRGTLARRLIANAENHPALADGRHAPGAAHIIDLSIIRDALGARWNDYADAIHRIATRTIERHLDGAHSYVRRADCYLLRFHGATPYMAMDRTRAISTALATYLIGDGGETSESRQDGAQGMWKPRPALSSMTCSSMTWPYMDWSRLPDRLRSLAGAIPAFVTGILATGNPAPRRGIWTGETVEPRIVASTTRGIETAAATSSKPISADAIAPSRTAAAEPSFHSPANDDGALSQTGTPFGPSPRIAADFRPPSRPTTSEEIDLDETNALEKAMKAAVERLARDSEHSAHSPSYHHRERRAATPRPMRRDAIGER